MIWRISVRFCFSFLFQGLSHVRLKQIYWILTSKNPIYFSSHKIEPFFLVKFFWLTKPGRRRGKALEFCSEFLLIKLRLSHKQVGRVEAEQLAMSWRISYFECSAKYNRVISQIFEELVRLVRFGNEWYSADYCTTRISLFRQFQFKEKHCNGSVPWLLNGVGGGDRPDTRNSNTVEKSKKKRKNCPIQ